VIVRAAVEAGRDGKLELRALLGVFGGEQIIDARVVQRDAVNFAVMQDQSLDRNSDLSFDL
jgi:hypothetical protein